MIYGISDDYEDNVDMGSVSAHVNVMFTGSFMNSLVSTVMFIVVDLMFAAGQEWTVCSSDQPSVATRDTRVESSSQVQSVSWSPRSLSWRVFTAGHASHQVCRGEGAAGRLQADCRVSDGTSACYLHHVSLYSEKNWPLARHK